jgi:Omp85 superfamily domain
MNKLLLLTAVMATALPAGCTGTPDESQEVAAMNVNARYIVESVSIVGQKNPQLSDPLRADLDQIIGQNLDHSTLDQLAARMKKELRVPDVDVQVSKGGTPDHVVVTFEIGSRRPRTFDMDLSRFLYHSKQGWSGQGHFTAHVDGNAFTLGLVSDGDRLMERYAGIEAGYERANVISNRLRLGFQFSTFHQQWNRATLAAADPELIYRSRQNFTPLATIVLSDPLEWSFGVDFARYRLSAPAARTESSNAVVSTLRYHQRWGSVQDEGEQEVIASYSIRSGTHFLESDAAFTRQEAEARYRFHRRHNDVSIGFLAGRIVGFAPLFERFVLGNAETLRGWSKFDLDPLGASRVIHGTIDYSYRAFLIFYDTGAVWDHPEEREQKQSLGVGLKKGPFQLAVAFPLRSGAANPVFYAGMNF